MSYSARLIPALLGLLAGVIVIVSFVQANIVSDTLLDVGALLVTIGLLFGILNVINVHRKRVMERAGNWSYSIVLIAALLTTFVLGVTANLYSIFANADIEPEVIAGDVLLYVYQPLASSVLALLTFFALRAAWRALQFRPREASIILGVAVVMLIASGPWASVVPGLAATLQWIRDYPVLGVARGLILGVGIGAVIAGTRLLLGLDQPYLDR